MDNELVKKKILKAFAATYGNVSKACKVAGISRAHFYDLRKEDPEFARALKELEPEEELLDMVEDKLFAKARKGCVTTLIFLAKTKGKKRGYVERQEVQHEGNDEAPIYFVRKTSEGAQNGDSGNSSL